MEYDVFISYSRKDYVDENKQVIPDNIISKIRELFDANGVSYWFDEEGVYSGDAFAPVLARNIKASKIFLFVSSSNSNASEWTSNEIAVAHQYKKKIIPFRFDDSVYNDSVIMYIARLDYIEYQSNPSKALSRLLNSIQTYLKTELEKKEHERQEEERRKQAEISQQERVAKLKNLRERIENYENRKFEIEKEILIHEKSLSDLRNEKRILEAEIINLQEEEAMALGHARTKKVAEPLPAPKIEKPKSKTPPFRKQNIWCPNILKHEWDEVKSAMTLKHTIVNILCILWIVGSALCFALSTVVIVIETDDMLIQLSIAGYTAMIGGYKLLKNYRSGYIWLFIASVFLGMAGFTVELELSLVFILFCVLAIGVYTLCLCIRKDGVSAKSLLKKEVSPIKNHKIQISIAVILLSLFVGNWIYWDVQLNQARDLMNSSLSTDELSDLSDELREIGWSHPFYDYWDSVDEYNIEILLIESKQKAKELVEENMVEAERSTAKIEQIECVPAMTPRSANVGSQNELECVENNNEDYGPYVDSTSYNTSKSMKKQKVL